MGVHPRDTAAMKQVNESLKVFRDLDPCYEVPNSKFVSCRLIHLTIIIILSLGKCPTAGDWYSSPLEFHIALSRAIGIWPYYSAVNYFYFFIYIYFSKFLLPLSPLSVFITDIVRQRLDQTSRFFFA